MSNRYNAQSNNQKKGFSKPLKRFIPRQTVDQTWQSSASSQTVAASSVGGGGGGGGGAAGNRIKMGENGEWVSNTKMHSGSFVNYLPQDEAVAAGLGADEGGLDPVESQRVVDLLNRELERLLKLKPRDFWKEVASDASLHAFIESFLKYRSRWYDFPYRGAKGIVAGVIVGEYELCRRVFMLLYRISSNRDPGARTADSLSPKDHTALLQEKKLLDLPKLLDICAIYGHENEDLTRLLVVNSIKAQRWMHDEFIAVLSHFLSIIHTMYERCSSSLEVLFSSGYMQDEGFSRLRSDYLEVMDFINDAVVTMDTFAGAYKHAAVFFSCPVQMSYGNEELLVTLARLHDSLLPSLQRGLHIVFVSGGEALQETTIDMLSDVSISLKLLSMRIVNLGWKLLYFCYLSDEAFDESCPFPTSMKMFPASVDDPVVRADILLQTLRDISEKCFPTHDGHYKETFLQDIEKHHKIMSRVGLLRNTGWISMDEQQFQFLSGMLRHALGASINETHHLPSPGTDSLQADEDTAILESKISQIKDLFPDYGKGFLAACLEAYNQNPEEVIQRILDCNLHKDLQSLDISLEEIPQRKSIPSGSTNDKGKGKLLEFAPVPTSDRISNKPGGPSNSSSSSIGRYTRKAAVDLRDSQTLDSRDERYMSKNAALISQLEYEDEYDDSFDDLGLSVGDVGLEETETLRVKVVSDKGKSQEVDNGSSAPSSASKWNSRRKPQFYVKDGKNYSYKVEGSIAVANYNEASLVNQAQRETIHGLGRGGNIPLGAVRRLTESSDEIDGEPEISESVGRAGRGNFRGRGRRGGGRNHYRKDQAMKKHFSGLTGV